jgi:hypothetical protein
MADRAASAPGWRVVVYTYHDQASAERGAHAITARWPEFGAEVHAPPTGKDVRVVTLGGRMTRAEAHDLLMKARTAGLPGGMYVHRF